MIILISKKGYSGNHPEEFEQNFLRQFDRGIDDMEAERELPMEEAFQKISELRKNRRDARI